MVRRDWNKLWMVMGWACAFCVMGTPLQGAQSRDGAGVRSPYVKKAELSEEEAEAEELQEEGEEELVESSEELLEDTCEEVVMGAYYIYEGYPRKYEGSHHWPTGRSSNGDTIDLEDGTKWGVYKGDALCTIDWEMGDRIVITNNPSTRSLYKYNLRNLDTDDCIRVNLSVGPFSEGPYTIRVSYINYGGDIAVAHDGAGRELELSFSSFDEKKVKSWEQGDSIVIGVNDDWTSWWNPYLFINVQTLESVRGNLSVY